MASLAILGCGKMGEALVAGLLSSKWCEPAGIVAADKREDRVGELARTYGITTTSDNRTAVTGAAVIVLAVKPQDVTVVLEEIGSDVREEQLVLSVCAGIPTAHIEAKLTAPAPVVRAMPNTAAMVHEGMAAVAPGRNAGPGELSLAEEILGKVGRVVRVEEASLDAVTAISGSGPAYFALVAEAMIEAGTAMGLSKTLTTELVVQTMLGSARLLGKGDVEPGALRAMVTSPGGTTAAALEVLEQAGLRGMFAEALEAAARRSQELSR